jgi:hypothetical protein
MNFKHYRIKVKHDKGTIFIHTAASDKAAARRIIKAAEGCPPSAIVSVEEQAGILKF